MYDEIKNMIILKINVASFLLIYSIINNLIFNFKLFIIKELNDINY